MLKEPTLFQKLAKKMYLSMKLTHVRYHYFNLLQQTQKAYTKTTFIFVQIINHQYNALVVYLELLSYKKVLRHNFLSQLEQTLL